MNGKETRGILCPRCRKFISADEHACPYCGLRRPGARRILRSGLSFFLSNDPIRLIIYVNAVFFILSLLLSPSTSGFSANPLTILSPSNQSLLIMGATGTWPIDMQGSWWTLISASYLHGGILHIFFNMMALMQLGPFVLGAYGIYRFFLIYAATGVGGFLLSYLAGVPFTIGASASICGLIGAILFYGKSRGGYFGGMIYRQAMAWTIGLVIFGLLIPGINNWAHGGGLAAGVLIGYLVGYNETTGEKSIHRTLGIAVLAATLLVLFWVLARTLYVLILA